MTDVGRWLVSSGFGQYAEAFAKNAIGWDVLAHLNYDILRDVGVRAAGDRIRIRCRRPARCARTRAAGCSSSFATRASPRRCAAC